MAVVWNDKIMVQIEMPISAFMLIHLSVLFVNPTPNVVVQLRPHTKHDRPSEPLPATGQGGSEQHRRGCNGVVRVAEKNNHPVCRIGAMVMNQDSKPTALSMRFSMFFITLFATEIPWR